MWTSRLQSNLPTLMVSPYDSPTSPVLLVSAIDIISGFAKNFDSREGEISVAALLASSAVPPVFQAAHVEGGVYWDALFCQNPPLRELGCLKPDEIWVIQVTPWSRGFESKKVEDMSDRRNELSGNIAMAQEIYAIEKINELVAELGEGDDKRLRLPSGKEYKHIGVRIVEMPPETSRSLDFASKIDRSPSFIRELMEHGEQRAGELLGEPL